MLTSPPRAGTRLEHVLARGVLAGRDRYLAWIRRHPRLVDGALVAVLLLLTAPAVREVNGGRQAWPLVLIPVLLVPLVWRRRAPFAVFAIISAAAFAQWFLVRPLSEDFALLIAFYTVAVYEPPRRVLAAGAVLEAGAVLAAVRYSPAGGDVVWAWVLISGTVTAAGMLGYYVRTRRAHLASLVDRAERLERERDREAELAASAERARIAREMHDIVAHNIAVMIALADGAAYTAADRPGEAAAIMSQVSGTGRAALTEMRRLLGVMRQPVAAGPGHAPPPTLADVDDLLAAVRAAGLAARLTVSGRPFPLPPTAQLALYRMIQEALTNTLKHAGATSAQIRLTYRPGEVGLEVTDNGQGESAGPGGSGSGGQDTAGQGAGGHGITGMRERAAVFGGEISAGPRPGGGWRVYTVLRVDAAAGPAAQVPAAGRPGPVPAGDPGVALRPDLASAGDPGAALRAGPVPAGDPGAALPPDLASAGDPGAAPRSGPVPAGVPGPAPAGAGPARGRPGRAARTEPA